MPSGQAEVSLELVVRAKDLTSAAMERVGRQGKTAGDKIRRAFKRVGDAMLKVRGFVSKLIPGLGQMAALFAGGLAIGSAVRQAFEFRKAMAEVSTIVDTTVVSMDEMRVAVLGIAKAQGSKELVLAKGLYQAISAGVEAGAKSTQFLADANRLAIASVAETNQAVDLLTSAINAYGFDLSETTRISDQFFKTVQLGKTTIPEIASAFSSVAPIAAELGISLEQVNAAIATLTLGGATTSEAVTRLSSVLRAFLNKNADINKVLEGTGLVIDENTFRTKTLAEVLDTLRVATGGSSVALSELLVRAEATLGVFGLTGRNLDKFNSVLSEVADSAGATGVAFDKQLADPAARAALVLNSLRIQLVEMGDEILVAVANAIDKAGGLGKLEEVFRILTTVVAEFSTAAVNGIAEIVKAVDGWLARIGGVTKITEVVRAAFGALTATIKVVFVSLVAVVNQLIDAIAEIPGSTAKSTKQLEDNLARSQRALDNYLRRGGEIGDFTAQQILRSQAEAAGELDKRGRGLADAFFGVSDFDEAAADWQKAIDRLVGSVSGDGTNRFLPKPSDFSKAGFDNGAAYGAGFQVGLGAGDGNVLGNFDIGSLPIPSAEEIAGSADVQLALDQAAVAVLQKWHTAFKRQQATFGNVAALIGGVTGPAAFQIAQQLISQGELDEIERRARKLAQLNELIAEQRTIQGETNFAVGIGIGIESVVEGLKNMNEVIGRQIAGGSFDLLRGFFNDIASGSKSAGEALKDLGRNFLKLFADIAAQLAAKQIILGVFGEGSQIANLLGLQFEQGGVMPGQRIGSLPVKGYAQGGIADSPQVAVYGEGSAGQFGEAFVPLGGNRKIPVEMRGGGGGGGAISLTLNVGSLDPRTATDVIMGSMDTIADGIAGAIQSGRNRNLTSALRGA